MHQTLSSPVQYLKGVGPALGEKLVRLGVLTIADLLHVLPLRYADRRTKSAIRDLQPGREKTVEGKIVKSGVTFLGRRKKRIYEVVIEDESRASVSAKFFRFRQSYMSEKYVLGVKVIFSGDVSKFGAKLQFIHPDVEFFSDATEAHESEGKILPIYPLTEGVHQKTMRKIISRAWQLYNAQITSSLPEPIIHSLELLDIWTCLRDLHFPGEDADVEALNSGKTKAHRTLIFEEFFFLELGLAFRRQSYKQSEGLSHPYAEKIRSDFRASLPFDLTNAQKRVGDEIAKDLQSKLPMNRLVQGDVGSGKTLVAIEAALQVLSNAHQVAFMAPTELLAEQHAANISKLLKPLGIEVALLTSSVKGARRKEIVSMLASGELGFVVGTHALIQGDVQFANLGLAIIDEQHRFGVLQRAAIKQKGGGCDILVMTATPIPRTLAMTVYGDLDISVLDEMPKGRKEIITKLYREGMRSKLYKGMQMELERGRQVYVVYPLIEESEKLDLKNASNMAEELAAHFSPSFRVGLLHGKLKADEKDKVMQQFKAGEIHILVSTTVIEVGIDIPNASVMVIEHAERFGLSQLHQLRGRVGRGSEQSYCIMMADYKLSDDGYARLNVMTETCDGFKIAEEDLKIRGPGEILGTRQSGIPELRVANLVRDAKILSQAKEMAFDLIAKDPDLSQPEHKNLKETLSLRWAGKLHLAEIS